MRVNINALSKSYGDNFTLSIPGAVFASGRITGLTGPNGAGKTTLLRIIAGLDTEYSGSITYDGKKMDDSVYKNITMCFQTPMLLHRSTLANLEYPLRVRGVDRNTQKQWIAEYVDLLDLANLLSMNAVKLSGGESQRVALARALVFRPKLLLLDEPFSAIDASSIEKMTNVLLYFREKTGATVVLVSHDQRQVDALCDDELALA